MGTFRSISDLIIHTKRLKPAALELSLEAAKNLESEREELDRLWEMRLERAAYEV